MVEIRAAAFVFKDDVIKLLMGKRISNIFSFRSRRTLKPSSNVISKKFSIQN